VCPSLNIFIDSIEKAENVVNPPKIPVVKNNCHSVSISFFELYPKTDPIKKHPTIFTANVPKGKTEVRLDWISFEIR
jgi:hypothetical protein